MCIRDRQLAERLGMNPRTIIDLETCQSNPKFETVVLVAKELNISVDAAIFPEMVNQTVSKTVVDFFAGKDVYKRQAHGGVKAQRVPCGGDPAGRGLPDNGQRLFPAPDRRGPGSGGATLRKAPLLYRPADRGWSRPVSYTHLMNRKPYISWIVKFPQTELLGLLGITVPVNPHSLAVSAAWRSAVGRLSGTEENTVRKTG